MRSQKTNEVGSSPVIAGTGTTTKGPGDSLSGIFSGIINAERFERIVAALATRRSVAIFRQSK
jgi:hypothetical protein